MNARHVRLTELDLVRWRQNLPERDSVYVQPLNLQPTSPIKPLPYQLRHQQRSALQRCRVPPQHRLLDQEVLHPAARLLRAKDGGAQGAYPSHATHKHPKP